MDLYARFLDGFLTSEAASCISGWRKGAVVVDNEYAHITQVFNSAGQFYWVDIRLEEILRDGQSRTAFDYQGMPLKRPATPVPKQIEFQQRLTQRQMAAKVIDSCMRSFQLDERTQVQVYAVITEPLRGELYRDFLLGYLDVNREGGAPDLDVDLDYVFFSPKRELIFHINSMDFTHGAINNRALLYDESTRNLWLLHFDQLAEGRLIAIMTNQLISECKLSTPASEFFMKKEEALPEMKNITRHLIRSLEDLADHATFPALWDSKDLKRGLLEGLNYEKALSFNVPSKSGMQNLKYEASTSTQRQVSNIIQRDRADEISQALDVYFVAERYDSSEDRMYRRQRPMFLERLLAYRGVSITGSGTVTLPPATAPATTPASTLQPTPSSRRRQIRRDIAQLRLALSLLESSIFDKIRKAIEMKRGTIPGSDSPDLAKLEDEIYQENSRFRDNLQTWEDYLRNEYDKNPEATLANIESKLREIASVLATHSGAKIQALRSLSREYSDLITQAEQAVTGIF